MMEDSERVGMGVSSDGSADPAPPSGPGHGTHAGQGRLIGSVFLAASFAFLLPPVVPIAARVFQAATVGIKSPDAVAWSGGNTVLSVHGPEGRATTLASLLARSTQPVQAEMILDDAVPTTPKITGNEAAVRGLGPSCLPDAMEPLLVKEAEGADRTYLTQVATDLVEAAYEAERFGQPLLDAGTATEFALGLLFLAWLSRKVLSKPRRAHEYVAPPDMVARCKGLERKIPEIESSLSDAAARMEELSTVVVEEPVPTFWDKLNPFAKVNEAELAHQKNMLDASVRFAELGRDLEGAREELARHLALMDGHRQTALKRVERRARLARLAGRVALCAALASFGLGTLYSALTFSGSEWAFSWPSRETVLMRSTLR